MKTKEFIKRVEKLGYKTEVFLKTLRIREKGCMIALIMLNRRFSFETNFVNKPLIDEELFDLIVEYVKTPIEEREEDKKYTYQHNFIKTKGNNSTYLAIRQRLSISYPVLQGSSQDIFEYKVEFTDEEMEEVKKEYGIFLDDFKKVEVEE